MASEPNRHKGKFTGVHLHDEHLEKVTLVEKKFDKYFGYEGRNRARAIRWFIESMPMEAIEAFPKDRASASMTA